MNIFLIDFGSTNVKYSVYNTETDSFEQSGSEKFPLAEIDDGIHYRVSKKKIKALILKLFNYAAEMCEKCFVSVQMHGYLFQDSSGEFTDYISWRDKSGNIKENELSSIDFYSRGTSLKENLPLVKILNSKQDVVGAEFYTLGSYIAFLLTARNITHITDACASGFYMFDGQFCEDKYFKGLTFPECTKQVECIGKYRGMDIFSPMGDHQISFMGSGAGADKYLLNIGTATQISCLGDGEYPKGDYEKRPYFDDKGLITVSGIVGGAELYKGQGIDKFFNSVEDALKLLPEKTGVIVGGGGAGLVFERLCKRLKERGVKCEMAKENIGREGLKVIAKKTLIKMGVMLSEMTFPNYPVIFKNCGLDFFIIDNEHGAFDYSAVSALLMNSRLSGFNSIIRLGSNSRDSIIKFADAGTDGFLLPMTDCAEDIKKVVEYAKYMPIGKRGISTTRAHTLYNPPELNEYMSAANERIKVYAQIETKMGVENIKEILNIEGVDGVFIGPNDLSADLGCIGDIKPVLDCIETVADAVRKAGKVWGVITQNSKIISFSKENDVNMISYGSELNMIKDGCANIKNGIEKA